MRHMANLYMPNVEREIEMATVFEERPVVAEVEDIDPDLMNQVGVKAAVNLMSAWEMENAPAAALVGVGDRTWSRMKGGAWSGELNQDQQMRVSGLVGLYQGLHVYFGSELADRWVHLENRGPLFDGRTPETVMLEGGLPAILRVRDYIDAIRGGL